MADTCDFCGPRGTFAGKPVHRLDCPDHGLVASLRLGACAQHPNTPVIGGICGDCTQYPEDSINPPAMTTEITMDATKLMEALAKFPSIPVVPRHPDDARRDLYAAAIRDHIKALTIPAPTPGGAPMLGATEYDLADVVLLLADTEAADRGEELDAAGATIAEQTVQANRLRTELAQLRAERDAALRLAEVWADAPDPLVRHSAADLLSAIRGAQPARLLDCGWCYEENGEEVHPHPECPIGVEACGDTATGMFGRLLGPCLNAPHPPATFHRDAHGAEWREYGPDDQLRAERDTAPTAICEIPHETVEEEDACERARLTAGATNGSRTKLNALIMSVAHAIHGYDYRHALTGNDIPGKYQHGAAVAAVAAITDYLTVADAEAWCKSCRRIWEGHTHRCESDAEQRYAALQQEHAQLDARATKLRRALSAVQRFNQLTTGSCRVQAAEHARDNLDILDSALDVTLTTNTSSAREDLLNLLAQWGLTTGRGSREHADRILHRRDHETAEYLRDWVREGDANAPENVLEGADRIDPQSARYAGRKH